MLLFYQHLKRVASMSSIYTRAKNEAGQWRYGRVKEGRGQRTSTLQPPFYARPCVNGKQTWTPLNALTFDHAKEEASHLEIGLEAQSKGLTVAELDAATNAHRLPIKSVVEVYLEQKKNKAKRTVQGYRLVLNEFVEALAEKKIRFLDAITVDALRYYKDYLVRQGYAGKTIDTRINIVYFMLKKNHIEARLPNDEMPTVETEAAVPYTQKELDKLFAAMDEEETIRYKFFLGSAARSQEVTFAAWPDIDFTKNEFHIRRKTDVGFFPKSHESRTVPLPASLVALLKVRHKKMPGTRWIFGGEDRAGNEAPGNHFLRKLKGIALRGGLNCGQCKTTITKGEGDTRRKVQVSCKDHAVCEHFYLHRFRKTCATRWHEANIPVRTIQYWLGHKNLETTMLYLGVTSSEKLRGNIDRAFGD
jgi:integrase/recombinase XerD